MSYLKTFIELRPVRAFPDVVLVYYPEADPDVDDVVAPGLERGGVTECCVAKYLGDARDIILDTTDEYIEQK